MIVKPEISEKSMNWSSVMPSLERHFAFSSQAKVWFSQSKDTITMAAPNKRHVMEPTTASLKFSRSSETACAAAEYSAVCTFTPWRAR